MTEEDFASVARAAEPAAQLVPIVAITVPERLRPIDESYVTMLAASIEDIGLSTPIVVRADDEADDLYILVAGAHRLAAAKSLDHIHIAAVVYTDMDDDSARLVEIDENLMRRELHALDRCIFLLERKVVYERLNPTAKNGGDRRSEARKPDGQVGHLILPPRFTAAAADATGFSERSIRRDVEIASKLDREAIEAIRGTKFAKNQQTLIALSQKSHAQQRTLAIQMRDGGAKTFIQAEVAAGFEEEVEEDPQKTYLGKLNRYWHLADPATRLAFLQSIDAAYLTVQPQASYETGAASPAPSRGGRKPGKGTR